MRWGLPEQTEIAAYEMVKIDEFTIYIHHAITGLTNARIDLVTGGVGSKLIFLGFR